MDETVGFLFTLVCRQGFLLHYAELSFLGRLVKIVHRFLFKYKVLLTQGTRFLLLVLKINCNMFRKINRLNK
jgi:hypothetical protein